MSTETGTNTESTPRRRPRCRARRLFDGRFENWDEVERTWTFEDLQASPEWREKWISFDVVHCDAERGVVWCGIASMANDILSSYEPATERFRSLGFAKVGDRFDCKIHKGFEDDGEGNFLFGTASLHDPNQQEEALGGKLVRFDPRTEKFEILAVPVPRQYIQNIAFDQARGLIYGMTFPMEYLFRHDINSGRTRILGHVGGGQFMGQPHYPVVAPDGTLWAAWGRSQAWVMRPTSNSCLLRYHPDEDRVHYLTAGPVQHGDPSAAIDSLAVGVNGELYVGSVGGFLYRHRPGSDKLTPLGTPGHGSRMAHLTHGPDGRLYGVHGSYGNTVAFAYDTGRSEFEIISSLRDEESGEVCHCAHSVSVSLDGRIFVGENDNPNRSSYLWEITP
jgi:hypothetical protein